MMVTAAASDFISYINKNKDSLKLIVLTKSDPKTIVNKINGRFVCVNLTKYAANEKNIFEATKFSDPTSFYLLLEQLILKVKPSSLYIEDIATLNLFINDIEKDRFLKMLTDLTAHHKVKFFIYKS